VTPRPRLPRLPVAALGVLLLATTACGDDDGGAVPTGATSASRDLLGPEDRASGDPVRIGMVSDGATPAYDGTDELRAAQATAEYWNTHRRGVGGRPVEVVTCETHGDPAGGTDCANQVVEQDVVAVALGESAVALDVWEPLHAAGVPTMWFQANGDAIASDDQSSFLLVNPTMTLAALPISVAESEDADTIAFVTIDVPQAIDGLEGLYPVLDEMGLGHETVAIPPGTADMTPQMQQIVDSGAGVVHVVGNDAFCIAAFNGLNAVGYDGAIASVSQCITDATRTAVPGDVLEGTFITSTVALGATDDPTFQLYEAVMDAYGQDVQHVANAGTMSGYAAMAALLTSLADISGAITPQTVLETIRAMPEAELPGAGGVTFRCDGSADPALPAVCTNQALRTQLDGEGQPASYEVVDASDVLSQ
jgi:branched-chain amino acid transport system substrate-binding protein